MGLAQRSQRFSLLSPRSTLIRRRLRRVDRSSMLYLKMNVRSRLDPSIFGYCMFPDTRQPASPTRLVMRCLLVTRSLCPTRAPRDATSRGVMRGVYTDQYSAFCDFRRRHACLCAMTTSLTDGHCSTSRRSKRTETTTSTLTKPYQRPHLSQCAANAMQFLAPQS